MIITPEQWMHQAIELARKKMRANEGGPFGAIVVRNGELVSEGWNQVTSHNDPTAHAEVVAIRRACKILGTFSLRGCELYASCEPCPMCLAAIYWARLDRFYFAGTREDAANAGFDDEALYKEILLPAANRQLPSIQILSDEAATVFSEWKNKADRIPY